MTIGIFKEWLVKYFFVHRIVLKAILVFQYTLDYLATFTVSKMASYVFVWSKNRDDIRDGNEYKTWKWLVYEVHGSGHLQIILHLNKMTNCLKITTFKIVFTFDVFFSAETKCTITWHVFYIRKRHISVSSFVYKYDYRSHDSHMTGRAGVWEADDIVQFYIALLNFFPSTL
jgi:hypothetical protein